MALEVQTKKKPKGPIKFQIQLNEEQKAVKTAILNNVITIVTGQAGSGKTLVACQAALDSLLLNCFLLNITFSFFIFDKRFHIVNMFITFPNFID